MGLRLLIVEDDRLLAEAVSDYFTAKGWKTKIVYNGKDAVEKAVRGSWEMILLDVMLPGRDGFSVCRKVREQTDTPIFFITARVMEEDELDGYAAGAECARLLLKQLDGDRTPEQVLVPMPVGRE